jgi:DNA-binding CsgD family transcriptional regulator
MSLSPVDGAVLIAMHAGILPFRQEEVTTELADAVPATRPTASSEYPLADEVCVIGRDPLCQVRVEEHRIEVSRRHATIKREHGRYMLYDHSLHGTLVNGQRISGLCRLDHGDIIGLANTPEMLRFIDTTNLHSAGIILTDREQEILRLLAMGRRIKEIATVLSISPNTVSSHLKNLYDKLGVSSRAEASSQAAKLHLL